MAISECGTIVLSARSSIGLGRLTPPLEYESNACFDDMFAECPKERTRKVTGHGEAIERRRFQASYEKADVPEVFESFAEISPMEKVTIRWYKSGADFMPAHSPSEKGSVYVIHLLESQYMSRTFRLKTGSSAVRIKEIAFPITHGRTFLFQGDCQEEYMHEVPQCERALGRRIEIVLHSS